LRALYFQHLAIRDLRVIRKGDIDPCPGINVIAGANGQGKTTLLEAIYLVATSRSFRTHKLREVIGHGANAFSVRATIAEADQNRQQFMAISAGDRVLKLDDDKPASLSAYAIRTPVVVFHPAEIALSAGPASARRTLLDRIALFIEPRSYAHVAHYARALKARNRLLVLEGACSPALQPYEQLLAQHGAQLTTARQRAAQVLVAATKRALDQLGPTTLLFEASYQPGGSTDPAEAREQLEARRSRDARRASPGFGPHLDDLKLELAGSSARVVASQGQHRLLTLGLKIGETVCIAEATGVSPVLLLDDVSSELDAARTDALFAFLTSSSHQVFVTTTRPEWVVRLRAGAGETRLFEMVAGQALQAPFG
jgi:DNA replication and repair protein RecF